MFFRDQRNARLQKLHPIIIDKVVLREAAETNLSCVLHNHPGWSIGTIPLEFPACMAVFRTGILEVPWCKLSILELFGAIPPWSLC